MRAKTLRTAAAGLIVLGLLATAAPAAAAPARGDGGLGPPLLQQLMPWLSGLWPGAAPGAADAPAAVVERLGSHTEPAGCAPAAGAPSSPTAQGDDDPTANPELGPRADPNG